MKEKNILEINGLDKKYEEKVIYENAKLEIRKNSKIVTICGESGSGKSTLINILLGYDQDYDGEVVVLGQNLKELNNKQYEKYLKEDVGLVHQEFKLYENLSILDNIRYINNNVLLINHLLTLLNLKGQGKQKVKNLSEGQKQKVAIIRAIINSPKLLIFDEPTSFMDRKTFKEFLNIIYNLSSISNILIITHDNRLKECSDSIYEIKNFNFILNSNDISNDILVNRQHNNKFINLFEDNKKVKDRSIFIDCLKIIYMNINDYITKVILLTILINLFVILFGIAIISKTNEVNEFYGGLKNDNVILMNFEKVKEKYIYNNKLYSKPNNKLFWSEEDRGKVLEIKGVSEVYFSNIDRKMNVDSQGNTLFENVAPTNYFETLKDKPSSMTKQSFEISFRNFTVPKEVDLHYYQEKSSMEMILLSGDYPDDDSKEILIPDILADQYILDKHYNSYNEVIGDETKIDVETPKSKTVTRSYIISGVYDTNYEHKLESKYYIYTPYMSDYFSGKVNEAYDLYNTYYEDTYFNFDSLESFENAYGTGCSDMLIILDSNTKSIDIYEEISDIYPNYIQISKDYYKTDPDVQKEKVKFCFNIVLLVFVFLITIFLIIFIFQKNYHILKGKNYSILLSLGYGKNKIFKLLLIEVLIDMLIIILVMSIFIKILHLTNCKNLQVYTGSSILPKFLILYVFIIFVFSIINNLSVIIKIKYKKLKENLK